MAYGDVHSSVMEISKPLNTTPTLLSTGPNIHAPNMMDTYQPEVTEYTTTG